MIHLIKETEELENNLYYEARAIWPVIYNNNCWYLYCLTTFKGPLEDLIIDF